MSMFNWFETLTGECLFSVYFRCTAREGVIKMWNLLFSKSLDRVPTLPCSLDWYSKQLMVWLCLWYNNTQWHVLSKRKTFQFDSWALSDRNDFRELHFDLWLVLAHHTWSYTENYRNDATYVWREFFELRAWKGHRETKSKESLGHNCVS